MNRPLPASSTSDIFFVTTVCFGLFILGSVDALMSGFPATPFTDAALFEILATELLLGSVALAYLRFRHYDLSLLKPVPTASGALAGAALCVAATVAAAALESLFAGSETATQPIDEMISGASISLVPVVLTSAINGLYEETFLVGYLQRALEGHGAAFAIGASLLVRMSYHLYQGPVGTASVLGFGAVLSLYFMRTGKLWPVVCAHILADLIAFEFS